jgi:hypothetical protein
MTTILLALAGPVLGLVGVVIGIWYGQRQWKKDRKEQKTDFFISKRRDAYIGLWELIQNAHIAMRISLKGPPSPESILSDLFDKTITEVNSFSLRFGIYIDDQDRALAQEFIELVYRFIAVASEVKIPDRSIQDVIGKTYYMPEEKRLDYPQVKRAEDAVNAISDQLILKIRGVLGAPPGELSPFRERRGMGELPPRLSATLNIILPRLSKPAPEAMDEETTPNEESKL